MSTLKNNYYTLSPFNGTALKFDTLPRASSTTWGLSPHGYFRLKREALLQANLTFRPAADTTLARFVLTEQNYNLPSSTRISSRMYGSLISCNPYLGSDRCL